MSIYKIPETPTTWIESTAVKIEKGYKPRCIVLRKVEGYHPFVVHTAYTDGVAWAYEQGEYSFTLEEALPKFTHRSKGF